MKTNIIITFFISIIFLSCNNLKKDDSNIFYNGIDSQILNIVDSTKISNEKYPFVTIYFQTYHDTCFVDILNSLSVPIDNYLISKWSSFKGYKKYKQVYLLFLYENAEGPFDRLIKRDSLKFDEEPFTLFNIYESDYKIRDYFTLRKTYFINKEDSLIFVKQEYI